jgi:uncharacterized protein (DUF2062 family)
MRLKDHKLVRLIVDLMRQGITPHKIALSVALGAMLGVIPVIGSSTLLCAAAALILGINLPLIQVVNYLVYPLQLLLLIPFIQAGQWLFREPSLPLSFSQLAAMLRLKFWQTLAALWEYAFHGLIAWLLLGGMAAFFIYIALRPILGRVVLKSVKAEKDPD